jgi:hypothetical protein
MFGIKTKLLAHGTMLSGIHSELQSLTSELRALQSAMTVGSASAVIVKDKLRSIIDDLKDIEQKEDWIRLEDVIDELRKVSKHTKEKAYREYVLDVHCHIFALYFRKLCNEGNNIEKDVASLQKPFNVIFHLCTRVAIFGDACVDHCSSATSLMRKELYPDSRDYAYDLYIMDMFQNLKRNVSSAPKSIDAPVCMDAETMRNISNFIVKVSSTLISVDRERAYSEHLRSFFSLRAAAVGKGSSSQNLTDAFFFSLSDVVVLKQINKLYLSPSGVRTARTCEFQAVIGMLFGIWNRWCAATAADQSKHMTVDELLNDLGYDE